VASKEHLNLLKSDRKSWNQWRLRQPEIQPDLSGAYLRGIDLRGADLRETNLSKTNLSRADLYVTDLHGADLRGAKLTWVNLIGADLNGADLNGASLIGAKLVEANLNGANLNGANLNGANLSNATMGWTLLGDRNLREVKGLDTVRHVGPSPLSINTIYLSEGDIPEVFVRGTGAPNSFIEYMHALAAKPIQYYTCFISYSSKDQSFSERLYNDLQAKGVRCWYAPEDLKIGDKFWHRIDESIRFYDKLLVVLSEYSVASPWVENEVMAALEKENKQPGKIVLFPIKLDETVMEANIPWAASMRRSRHIGDFRQWKSHDDYQKAFERLLRALKAGK